jgi:hypothetical protein
MGTTTKRLAPEDAALSLRLAEASANPSLADTLELVHLSSEDVGHAGASYQAKGAAPPAGRCSPTRECPDPWNPAAAPCGPGGPRR